MERQSDLPTIGNQFSMDLFHFCPSSEQSIGSFHYRFFKDVCLSKQPGKRFYYILARIDKIENTESNKFWIQYGATGTCFSFEEIMRVGI